MDSNTNDVCKIKGLIHEGVHSRLLVNFGHGPLSKKEAQQFSCSILSREDRGTDDRIAVVASDKRSYTGLANQDPLCQVLLLIKNKNKKKGRLVSVPMGSLGLPRLRKEVVSQQLENSLVENDTLNRSQVVELTRMFGSKKSKRQSEIGLKIEQNTVDNKVELEQTISDIKIGDADISVNSGDVASGEMSVLSILPPHNRTALDLKDVYKIDDLLGRKERDSLKAAAQFCVDNPPTKADEVHSFFLSSYFKLIPAESKLEGMVLLIYADSLLTFLKTPLIELKRKRGFEALLCPHSHAVGVKIINEFTVKAEHTRTRPAYMKDKVVCYVMILILLACDFVIDLSVLIPFLKGIHQTKIKQLAKVVGIVPMAIGSQKFLLKLPLPPLPTIYRRRTR